MLGRFTKFVFLAAALSLGLFAQLDPNPSAITRLKQTRVSIIEHGMPAIPFERWFAETAGANAEISYESNDCGERSGTPDEKGKSFPLCVLARAQTRDGWQMELTFTVGTYVVLPESKPSLKGYPQLFSAYIRKNDLLISDARTLAGAAAVWASRHKP